MEQYIVSAADLVTGSGLPALYSSEWGPAFIAGGAALGVALAYFEVFRRSVPFAPAVFRIVLSAAQFFTLWQAKDSDVGAGLVAVPFFFLVCCAPVGSASEYLSRARLFSAALNAAVLAAAGIYYGNPKKAAAAAVADPGALLGVPGAALAAASAPAERWASSALRGDSFAAFRGLLAVSDAAFAAASADRYTTAIARGAVLALLSFFPELPKSLLLGPTPEWLLLLYGASLVQSAQVQACSLRLELSAVTDPQRSLMLLVASALAVGFVERQGDPLNLSIAALAVLSLGVLSWAAQAKWVQRND
jgi:hypothetical protein